MKYRYEKVKVIIVKNTQEVDSDMLSRVRKYIEDRTGGIYEWKTATQVALDIGFIQITQVETRAVASALRKIGIRSKNSGGLKFLV